MRLTDELDKYEPGQIEGKWYNYWETHGVFHDEIDETKEPYSIVLPPPNVTGQLHMGHALDNTLQDILIRYKRMQGFNVLWLCTVKSRGYRDKTMPVLLHRLK